MKVSQTSIKDFNFYAIQHCRTNYLRVPVWLAEREGNSPLPVEIVGYPRWGATLPATVRCLTIISSGHLPLKIWQIELCLFPTLQSLHGMNMQMDVNQFSLSLAHFKIFIYYCCLERHLWFVGDVNFTAIVHQWIIERHLLEDKNSHLFRLGIRNIELGLCSVCSNKNFSLSCAPRSDCYFLPNHSLRAQCKFQYFKL